MLILIILGILFVSVFGYAAWITLSAGYDPNNLKCIQYRSDNFVVITVSETYNGYSTFCNGSHESEHYFVDQGYHVVAASSLEIYLEK